MTLTARDIRIKPRMVTTLAVATDRTQTAAALQSDWLGGYHGTNSIPVGSGGSVVVESATTSTLHMPESPNPVALVGRGFTENLNSMILMYDRIVHTGGGSHSTLAVQQVNTVALPRYTDGKGVFPFIEVYATGAGSPVYGTISYTNQDGVPGRTGTIVNLVAAATFCNPVTLQSGDTGVRSVETVTMSSAGSTAGNFGITLARFICPISRWQVGGAISCFRSDATALELGVVMMPPGAFLWFLTYDQGGSGTREHFFRADWIVE